MKSHVWSIWDAKLHLWESYRGGKQKNSALNSTLTDASIKHLKWNALFISNEILLFSIQLYSMLLFSIKNKQGKNFRH